MDDPQLDLMDDVDRRLDPLVPTTPLPADLLLRAHRARRRRTRTRVLGVVAAVVVLAGAGVAVGHRDTTSTVPLADDTTSPSVTPRTASSSPTTAPVPDGMVLLTYRGVSFAVPDSWSLTDDDCRITNPGEAAPLYVHESGTAGIQCGSRLLVAAYPFGSAVARGTVAPVPVDLNGLSALRGSSCPPNAACKFATGIMVRIPDARVALLISGPPDQRALLEQIVSTIRPSTDG